MNALAASGNLRMIQFVCATTPSSLTPSDVKIIAQHAHRNVIQWILGSFPEYHNDLICGAIIGGHTALVHDLLSSLHKHTLSISEKQTTDFLKAALHGGNKDIFTMILENTVDPTEAKRRFLLQSDSFRMISHLIGSAHVEMLAYVFQHVTLPPCLTFMTVSPFNHCMCESGSSILHWMDIFDTLARGTM